MSTIIDEAAFTDVERIKQESRGLRGTLGEELTNELAHVSHDADSSQVCRMTIDWNG